MTDFHLQLAGSGPLHRDIYDALLGRVRGGELEPGALLPPTRVLADILRVSRTPVLRAYEQLALEGWIEGRRGSGTRVADTALPRPAPRKSDAPPANHPALSGAARRARKEVEGLHYTTPFPGQPDPRHDLRFAAVDPTDVPGASWRRLLGEAARECPSRYEDAAGRPELREAIAIHLAHARGVRCDATRVVITAGTQQALDLVARMLVEPDDRVALEDPGHLGARLAFRTAGARTLRLPVDRSGARVDASLGERAPRVYYVTPTHQFPLGGMLPLERRAALLERARREKAWIVEDDYDGDFRYGDAPIPSLQGLDAGGRVIYLGTFSKTLMPALRIGFAVLPEELVEPFVTLKAIADGGNSSLEQYALARFLRDGHYARHLRRVGRRHAERRTALLSALERELGAEAEVAGDAAGLHVAVRLPDVGASEEDALVQAAAERGVGVSGALRYFARRPRSATLLLGHACVAPARMGAAVRRLRRALEDLRRS